MTCAVDGGHRDVHDLRRLVVDGHCVLEALRRQDAFLGDGYAETWTTGSVPTSYSTNHVNSLIAAFARQPERATRLP